jgi:uncharacterized phage-associated protein
MKTQIAYRINYEKAVEALVWLADQKPGIDIYHVAKVLFYADKKHVNRCARPILGDTYICMNYGPVPSGVRDLISEGSWLSPDYLEKASEALSVENKPYPTLTARRKPDPLLFSRTDLECLRESLSEYGEKSFPELMELTHNDRCWIESGANQPIDYALFVDDSNPNRQEILEEMAETAAYVQL